VGLSGCWCFSLSVFPGPNPGTQAAAWAAQSLDRARATLVAEGRRECSEDPGWLRYGKGPTSLLCFALLDEGRWRCSLLVSRLRVLSQLSASARSISSEASRK
jgi:hypothetical protein